MSACIAKLQNAYLELSLEHLTHTDLCDFSPADCSDFGVCVHGACDEANDTCK